MRIRLRRYLSRSMRARDVRAVLAVAASVVLFAVFWQGVNVCLRPAVETMARSSAVNRMTKGMAAAVDECVRAENLTYEDFVRITTDDTGQITSLISDLASVTLLKTCVANHLTAELDTLCDEEFGIPLGTLTGWVIFSGKGPKIRVELLSVGDTELQVRHSFQEAGINQTLHQIFLDVSAAIYLMIPGEVLTETVETSVCVAETIIVGMVPDTYLQVGNGE